MSSDGTSLPAYKRQRLGDSSPIPLDHATWVSKGENVAEKDFLKMLYPHARDGDCFLEEATHTYFVHNASYNCSVSSVWKVFFEEFNSKQKAKEILQKAEVEGVRSFASSLYNLYVYLLMEKRFTPDSDDFFPAVVAALGEAMRYYNDKKWTWCYTSVDDGVAQMKELIAGGCLKPKKCKSCYFLTMNAGCSSTDLCRVWEMNGSLESFKGTLLHKRAELYMQELAAWQIEQGRSHVTIREMHAVANLTTRARSAASTEAALCSIAPHTRADMWNHAATQAYLSYLFVSPESIEYKQLERWFASNPNLSPFRSEWSIFDEEAQVAGQVDSLWFDEDAGGCVVMADWKRARELLSPSEATQRAQSFGEKGARWHSSAARCENSCADMYNCAYNHYLVQQHLYADFLYRKYDVNVERMFLVQCHPNLGQNEDDFNVAELSARPGLAQKVLNAFQAGWKSLLPQFAEGGSQ